MKDPVRRHGDGGLAAITARLGKSGNRMLSLLKIFGKHHQIQICLKI
jgi:hypothetical protein